MLTSTRLTQCEGGGVGCGSRSGFLTGCQHHSNKYINNKKTRKNPSKQYIKSDAIVISINQGIVVTEWLSQYIITIQTILCGWFGVVVNALVAPTKLSYVEPSYTGTGDHLWWVYHPKIYADHSGPLILAFAQCIGAMSTDDGFGHRYGRNGKFCVVVGTFTKTAGIQA